MANQHHARYQRIRAGAVTFVFAFDATDPGLLHIYARHLKHPKDAIWAWYNGQHVWNSEHARFEGQAERIGVYWFWLEFEAAKVMVVSCFDA